MKKVVEEFNGDTRSIEKCFITLNVNAFLIAFR